MADRTTKDVLLRLRKLAEVELRRELGVERAERAAARREAAQAEAARRKLETGVTASRTARTEGWNASRTAGRLVYATRYEAALESSLRRARIDERKAAAALDRAETNVKTRQRALGEAMHARQRSETLARAERAADVRAKERREQAEAEDRWRAPTKSPTRR